MTQDDIVKMALEAGYQSVYLADVPAGRSYQFLERFATLVAAHEREACAKLLEDAAYTGRIISCTSAAKAIRARGENAG